MSTGRAKLVRDAVFFQVKLFLDGIMDLFLGPISLIFAIIEIVRGKNTNGRLFYDFLRYGRRVDGWIDRFAAVDEKRHAGSTIDSHVRKVGDSLRTKP